jgi:DNA-binding NarL/FixJ family response regulator
MHIQISEHQLEALEAVAAGDVYRADDGTWRHVDGRSLNAHTWALIERGYATEAEPRADVVFAEVTQEGRAVLAEFASRGPAAAHPPREAAARPRLRGPGRRRLVRKTPPSPFNETEARLVSLLATGRTYKEIAPLLYAAPATVCRHALRLRTLTGTRNNTELVAQALRNGWIT